MYSGLKYDSLLAMSAPPTMPATMPPVSAALSRMTSP
jgi:hypothetical protein